MLLRRDFVQRDDVWMDGIYYDWSLGLNAYFHGEKAITHIGKPLNWHRSHPQEAALLQSLSVNPAPKSRPTWQPYVLGYAHFRRLQRKPAWQRLYSHILENTLPSSSHHGKTDAQPQSSDHAAPLHDMYEAPPRHISQRGEDQRNDGNGARLLLADDICLPMLAVRPVRFGARRVATTLSTADIIVSYYLRSHHFFSMAGRKLEVFVYICIMLSASGKNAVQTFMQHKLYKHNLL